MKILLSVVIVLLFGLCGWVRYTSIRPSEAHRAIISGLKAELKVAEAEFDASRAELATARADIENLRRRLASLEQNEVARNFSGEDGSVMRNPKLADPSSHGEPSVKSPLNNAVTLEESLSDLKAIFEMQLSSIEARRNRLDADIASLKARKKSVESTEHHFSEQTASYDQEGNMTGNRGVRTSSADRERAKAKVTASALEVDREIAKKQVELDKVFSELDNLRENYSKAIVRVRGEFGVSGNPGFAN